MRAKGSSPVARGRLLRGPRGPATVHGMIPDAPRFTHIGLAEISFSPTAALWEGGKHAGTETSIFVVRTPPGGVVNLHTHPYSETFVVLRGRGRWTAGDHVTEPPADSIVVVPPHTLHGFRNIGDVPLLVVSVHESGTLDQTFTDREPA
jgi:quercetin dioxygenase-like cupin family protein